MVDVGTLHSPTVSLDAKEYTLARQRDAALSHRVWQVERRAAATKRIPRPDVRPGDIEGEYVIVWDDWSKGIGGDHENLPGTLHYTRNIDHSKRGALRSVATTTFSVGSSTDWEIDPGLWIKFNNEVYLIAGRFVFRFANDSATTDLDLGAGVTAQDAIVFNNELVIALGGSTNKIRSRNTSGSWTTASDNTFADYFGVTEDRLWRATATNEVSNIGPTDNPLTLANWSSGIAIGDNNIAITDLNGYGERIAVSKQNGLFLGDNSAIFPNVLPQLEWANDPDTGKPTLVRGADIFFPYRDGLIRYNLGQSEEVGPQLHFESAELSTNMEHFPGLRIAGLASHGKDIWASMNPSWYSRADPTGAQFTTDNGSSYTDVTTALGDNGTGVMTLDSLDTAANGDWFIIGHSAAFSGVVFTLTSPNSNASVMTVEYWNGSAWTAIPTANGVIDGTTLGGATLGRSGTIYWASRSLSSWATSTINGIDAFWIRFSVSAALDADVGIMQARTFVDRTNIHVMRGRPRRPDDVRSESIIWETRYSLQSIVKPTALFISDQLPFKRGAGLLVAGKQQRIALDLDYNAVDNFLREASTLADAYFCKHDGGMPEENKQFLDATVKGRTIDADRDYDLEYRLDETSGWTSLATAVITSPATQSLSAITGRAIQLHFDFNVYANDVPTEVNEVEVRFRVLPTYKNLYTMLLVLDGTPSGTPPAQQLTDLEDLHGAVAIVLREPGPGERIKTVNIIGVRQVELSQDEITMGSVMCEILAAEV